MENKIIGVSVVIVLCTACLDISCFMRKMQVFWLNYVQTDAILKDIHSVISS